MNRVWDRIEKIIKDTMDKIIPNIEIYKSDISNKPKLMTDTYKLNRWLKDN